MNVCVNRYLQEFVTCLSDLRVSAPIAAEMTSLISYRSALMENFEIVDSG